MKNLTVNRRLEIKDTYNNITVLEANRNYVVPDMLVTALRRDLGQDFILNLEEFVPTNMYAGEDLNGKTLVAFRNGGIGDLLFITTQLKRLKVKHPEAKITLVSYRVYQPLLKSDAYALSDFPLLQDELKKADYCIYFQDVIENNPNAEIFNAYELMSKHLGLEHDPAVLPEINLETEVIERVAALKAEAMTQFGIKFPDATAPTKHIAVQVAASVTKRSPHPQIIVDLIKQAPADCLIWMFGNQDQQELITFLSTLNELKPFRSKFANGSNIFKSLDEVSAFIQSADLVIGPDSSFIHIAGAFGVPVIGLYGPFPSALRMSTYKKAIGIDSNSNCEFARGEHRSCYEHGDKQCRLSQKIAATASPCLNLIKINHLLDAMARLGFAV